MATANPMKPRGHEIRHDPNVSLRVRRAAKLKISRELYLPCYWNVVGPVIAEEIAGTDYSPIPYCLDASAYNIGHIFVQVATQVQCCRGVPIVKILGPVAEFVVRSETDRDWCSREFPSIKRTGDLVDFKVTVRAGEDFASFAGHDYYFLERPEDMPAAGNLTIDRTAHESLSSAKWIGLITGVLMTSSFEIHVAKHFSERMLRVDDVPRAVLFKYEICQLNPRGAVVKATARKIRCEWLPLDISRLDRLPLPELVVNRAANS